MNATQYEILVPCFLNDGSEGPADCQPEHYANEVASWLGGATIDGRSEGVWIGPDGTVYRDSVRRIVAIDASADPLERKRHEGLVRELCRCIAFDYGQEAVALTVSEVSFEVLGSLQAIG